MRRLRYTLAAALVVVSTSTQAAAPVLRPMVSLAQAEQLAAACEAFAAARELQVAIAVVDAAGGIVLIKRMDQAGYSVTDLALAKARTSAAAGAPSSKLRDAVKGGSLGLLSIPGIVTVGGGLPLRHEDRVIGGIGVSGASEDDDVACAAAGMTP